MLGSFGHPTSNNAQQCPTMLAFVGINVGIVWPGLKMIASKDFVTYSDDSFSSSTDGREFNFQTNSVRHT